MIQSFLAGDFERALRLATELQAEYHRALLEGSKLRFKLNFGTPICRNCEGLKAGPGVVATCYQVERCDFRNIREEVESPKHLKILDRIIP